MIGRLRRALSIRAGILLRRVLHAPPRRAATDYSIALPIGGAIDTGNLRAAAVVHLFNAEMIDDIRDRLIGADYPLDLLLTTDTEEKRITILTALDGFGGGSATVRLVPNRGRDIAPKLTAFTDRYDDYDVLLFLHAKKSDHMHGGLNWRDFLFRNLLGPPDHVRSIVGLFAARPDLGIVFAQHYEPIRRYLVWNTNLGNARRLSRPWGIGLRPRAPLDFPSGSMFWARPAALRPLFDLKLTPEDFPEEAGQTEGTIAHAVERLFLFSAEHAGFDWLKVADPALYDGASARTIVPLASMRELDGFVARHGLRLLGDRAGTGRA